MNKDELTALKESIASWEREKVKHHHEDCPLCDYSRDKNGFVDCTKCPVMRKTEQESCHGTPYYDHSRNQTPENAQRMIDFLKSLLPEDEMKDIDLTKPVQTRDGRKVRVLCTDMKSDLGYTAVGLITDSPGDETETTWDSNGKYYPNAEEESHMDLINVPEKRVVWVNMYPAQLHWPDRGEADNHASSGREACIRVEYEVGQFDEEKGHE